MENSQQCDEPDRRVAALIGKPSRSTRSGAARGHGKRPSRFRDDASWLELALLGSFGPGSLEELQENAASACGVVRSRGALSRMIRGTPLVEDSASVLHAAAALSSQVYLPADVGHMYGSGTGLRREGRDVGGELGRDSCGILLVLPGYQCLK